MAFSTGRHRGFFPPPLVEVNVGSSSLSMHTAGHGTPMHHVWRLYQQGGTHLGVEVHVSCQAAHVAGQGRVEVVQVAHVVAQLGCLHTRGRDYCKLPSAD
ncbi:hypothetical protein HaLaN_01379 [Haematococcus lacustris]|uniref:Uncharacterized protein n=1 Tax=Haematococcus lacustris TaxID=44745 RepID=A0A699Y951_HAELA|nr:hypothetical protein HaLaN_01379 [Haematococcus lacustris]